MLRNQAGVGGVGTYWVSLVAGGLVEDDSGHLTPRGAALGDIFLKPNATPDRAKLLRVLGGEDVNLPGEVLAEWGRVAHLSAASIREQALLADALLEPGAHRRMAESMQAADATTSDGESFGQLEDQLRTLQNPLSNRLASVLAVTRSFESLHRALLYQFNQVLALGHHRPVPIKDIKIDSVEVPLLRLGDELKGALVRQAEFLPASVADVVRRFSLAVEPVVSAKNDADLVRSLVRHHERVQGGKFDASRQPKLPWVETRGNDVVVAPRYSLDERPEPPGAGAFTHPYRIEQFAGMLREAGAWEPST
jgi:hypothetical protein